MVILIAGATGFIGQALVHHFLSKNHQIIILSRSKRKSRKIFDAKVQVFTWQELNLDLVKNADAVINLCGESIGEKRWTNARRLEIINSRIKPTQTLVKLCQQLSESSPPLINASAVGIYDFVDNITSKKFFDEKTPIDFDHSPHFLGQVARLWEKATWPARDSGVRVVNVRFAVVLGSWGGMLQKLLPMFKLGLGSKIGNGQQPLTWVSLTDVVRAIQFTLDNLNIEGPVNIVSPQIVSQFEFAKILAEVLHRPLWLSLPKKLVKIIFGEMGTELLLNGSMVEPSVLLSHRFNFQDIDLKKVLAKTSK